jgi:hypothetical protein
VHRPEENKREVSQAGRLLIRQQEPHPTTPNQTLLKPFQSSRVQHSVLYIFIILVRKSIQEDNSQAKEDKPYSFVGTSQNNS